MCVHRFSNSNGCKFCINVLVSYSGDKRNGVYKMCKHRSSNGTGCEFSIKVEVSYSSDKRKGVYKVCIHRSSNGSSGKFSLEVAKVARVIRGTVCKRCAYIVSLTVMVANFV